MKETYYAVKEGKPLSYSDINAIFSAMYTPHTPTTANRNDTSRHYQKMNDDFIVMSDEKGARLKGKISPTLINRLKGYGVELLS